MILDRFDGVIFIGDDLLQHVYSAFNILLRENVALGGLKQWEMSESDRSACRCDNQFVKSDCAKYAVTSSEQVVKNDGGSGHPSPYLCSRKSSHTQNHSIRSLIHKQGHPTSSSP